MKIIQIVPRGNASLWGLSKKGVLYRLVMANGRYKWEEVEWLNE